MFDYQLSGFVFWWMSALDTLLFFADTSKVLAVRPTWHHCRTRSCRICALHRACSHRAPVDAARARGIERAVALRPSCPTCNAIASRLRYAEITSNEIKLNGDTTSPK